MPGYKMNTSILNAMQRGDNTDFNMMRDIELTRHDHQRRRFGYTPSKWPRFRNGITKDIARWPISACVDHWREQ